MCLSGKCTKWCFCVSAGNVELCCLCLPSNALPSSLFLFKKYKMRAANLVLQLSYQFSALVSVKIHADKPAARLCLDKMGRGRYLTSARRNEISATLPAGLAVGQGQRWLLGCRMPRLWGRRENCCTDKVAGIRSLLRDGDLFVRAIGASARLYRQ